MRGRAGWVAMLVAVCSASGADAQPAAGGSLEARSEAFLRAASRSEADSLIAYFPREGTWTWTQRYLDRRLVVRWRFGAEETLRAIDLGGPACDLFDSPRGDTGPVEGSSLGREVMEHGTGWRLVPGNGFVPPGSTANSPTYVRWRRERGAWVITEIGGTAWYHEPRLLGRDVNSATTDTSAESAYAYAPSRGWFRNTEPILFGSMRFVMYGLPRELGSGELARIGEIQGVPIYAEAGASGNHEVIYVAVRDGAYQPYTAFGSPSCHDLNPVGAGVDG